MSRPIPGPHSPLRSSRLGPEARFGVDSGLAFPALGEGKCKEGSSGQSQAGVGGGAIGLGWNEKGLECAGLGEEVSEGRKRAGKNEPCKQEARGQRLLEPGRPSGLVSRFQPQPAPAASCPCACLLGWAEGGGAAQGQGLAGVDSVF